VAIGIAVAVPEAYVIGWVRDHPLPDDASSQLSTADAVLVGPGLDGDAASSPT
jgi:hypothetical protein